MKNVINYFYGILVDEYKSREKNFSFVFDMSEYEFVQYYGDINKLINIYYFLKENNIIIDEIIINNKNSFITFFENKPYVLLRKTKLRQELDLTYIYEYNNKIQVNNEINWKKLWIEKIDYYIVQLEENGIKYPILKESFGYFLGMSECAISLLNYINSKNIVCSISHKRIEQMDDLYNPLNIIIDTKVRDIAEYIKTIFFYKELDINQINILIYNKIFTNEEAILFLARLIYPSYYFDLYEKIYNSKDEEKNLQDIIKKIPDYEIFLKKIYKQLKFIYNIPQIEFLEFNQDL